MIFIIQFIILACAISFVMAGTYFDQPRTIVKVGLKYWGLLCSAGLIIGIFLYLAN